MGWVSSRFWSLMILSICLVFGGMVASRAQEKKPTGGKAKVVADYPSVVDRNASGRWSWQIKFKETDGKSGCKLSGIGYIFDPRWGRWASSGGFIIRRSLVVPAGGEVSESYWCKDSAHKFCNGYGIFTWTGKDDGHNDLKIVEKVLLRHKGCPGPKKKQ